MMPPTNFASMPPGGLTAPPPFMSGGADAHTGELPLAGDAPQASKAKPHALVVDDAPDVTEMVALLMERYAGYDVTLAYSASEALAEATARRFDVVISDIGMPGMNGYELAEALRRLPGYAAVPLIAVTGYSMYDDRQRALNSGFNDFLTKPISPADLLNAVKRLGA